MEIAVFGGSFDPPTQAHTEIVRACLEMPNFDQVWLLPSGERADKPDIRSAASRLAMLEVVRTEEFASDPRLQVSQFEMQLPQPTETYQTYQALQETQPNDRFWFVFGADSIMNMNTWGHGDELLEAMPMLAVPRLGYRVPKTAKQVQHLPALPIFELGISSTQVRERAAQQLSVDDLVCASVAQYITERRLYATA